MATLTTRSMFGSQPVSRRRSSPMFGFGSSTRHQAAKVFLSSEHAKLSTSGFSPGPSAYTLRASVGSQADGRKASSPQWVFGSAERFGYGATGIQNPGAPRYRERCLTPAVPRGTRDARRLVRRPAMAPFASALPPANPRKKWQCSSSPCLVATACAGPGSYDMPTGVGQQVSSSKQTQPMFGFGSAGREHVAKVFVSEDHNKSLFGIDSPGPQVYTLQGAVGRQDLSKTRNQPAWVFASSNRFRYDHVKRAATSPGPGSYTLSQSVGSQVVSTKASSPMPGFGTSNRDQMNKLYISTEHEKAQSGNNSPGPCNYALPEATGRQPLSKFKSGASWGFGTSSR